MAISRGEPSSRALKKGYRHLASTLFRSIYAPLLGASPLFQHASGASIARSLLPALCLVGLLLTWGLAQEAARQADPSAADKKKTPDRAARRFDVDFGEDGQLRVALEFAALELESPYGKLSIPVERLRRIDFALRLTPEATTQIQQAIANLGSGDFAAREAASKLLLDLKDKSYPAVLKATKHADLEVSHRAAELAEQLRKSLPSDQLVAREYDVVETVDSILSGRLTASALPVSSAQFGALQVQLTDVRSLQSVGTDKSKITQAAIRPDPGILPPPSDPAGTVISFRVTGRIAGRIWGSGVYTTESHLATAAVHAGALADGETGIVQVTIVPSPLGFQSTSQNGVVSEAYGNSAHATSYQIHPKAAAARPIRRGAVRIEER